MDPLLHIVVEYIVLPLQIEEFVASVGISDSLLSSAKENVDWYDKHSGVIENWLQQNSSK